MSSLSPRILYWAPRALSIAFIAFLSLFALDVFDGNLGFWPTAHALLLHLVPSSVLAAALILAWRWEWVGTAVFTSAGLLYIAWVVSLPRPVSPGVRFLWGIVMAGPAFVIAGLFLANWLKRGDFASDCKRLIREYYEEVVNTGKVDGIARFVSPDYVEFHDNEKHSVGLAGAKAHVLDVRQTYPDLHLTVEQQIAEGEWVVTRVTMRGTHEGVWQGIQPTGKTVEVTAVNIDRVVGGRIVEHGGAANLLEPLLKIGAIQVVPSASVEAGQRQCSRSTFP